MIEGTSARVKVLRQRLRFWKQAREDAVEECDDDMVAACDESIKYFRDALSQEQ